MKKTAITLCLVAVLGIFSALAQEGCNGPKLVPGSSVDTCGPCSESGANSSACPGVTGYRNDYTACGGILFSSCTTSNQIVGWSWMPCTISGLASYNAAIAVYNGCVTGCGGNLECVATFCTYPKRCDYVTCSSGTTGGTPIVMPVVGTLGDFNGCVAINNARKAQPIVQLALAMISIIQSQ